MAGYEGEDNQYFGCTTGRVCNRIASSSRSTARTTRWRSITSRIICIGGVERSLDKAVWKADALRS